MVLSWMQLQKCVCISVVPPAPMPCKTFSFVCFYQPALSRVCVFIPVVLNSNMFFCAGGSGLLKCQLVVMKVVWLVVGTVTSQTRRFWLVVRQAMKFILQITQVLENVLWKFFQVYLFVGKGKCSVILVHFLFKFFYSIVYP